jgi:hypothetical protein
MRLRTFATRLFTPTSAEKNRDLYNHLRQPCRTQRCYELTDEERLQAVNKADQLLNKGTKNGTNITQG